MPRQLASITFATLISVFIFSGFAYSETNANDATDRFNEIRGRINQNVEYLMDLLPPEKKEFLITSPAAIDDKLQYISKIAPISKDQFIQEYLTKSADGLREVERFIQSLSNEVDRKMAYRLIRKIHTRLKGAGRASRIANYRAVQLTINKSFNFLGTLDNLLISDDDQHIFENDSTMSLKKIGNNTDKSFKASDIRTTLLQQVKIPMKRIKNLALTSNEDFETKKRRTILRAIADIKDRITGIQSQVVLSGKPAAKRIEVNSLQALDQLENTTGEYVVAGLTDSLHFTAPLIGHTEEPGYNCQKDHPSTAETECPTYIDFYTGLELTGTDEFAESFPKVGVRVRGKLYEKEKIEKFKLGLNRLNYVLQFGLTSRTAQAKGANTITVDGTKAVEGRGGFLIDVLDLEIPFTNSTGVNADYSEHVNSIKSVGILLELGFNSIDNFPKSANVPSSEGPSDLFEHHFAGIRLYNRGSDTINGAYVDVGWGISENFRDNEYKRFKFRGYVPIRTFTKAASGNFSLAKPFAALEIDSDFKDGEDEVKLVFGASVEFDTLLTALGTPFKLLF